MSVRFDFPSRMHLVRLFELTLHTISVDIDWPIALADLSFYLSSMRDTSQFFWTSTLIFLASYTNETLSSHLIEFGLVGESATLEEIDSSSLAETSPSLMPTSIGFSFAHLRI